MRVSYLLTSTDLKEVADQAAWAENMGYDGVAAPDNAHDPFLMLALAANATSRVTLDTRVAIAFPRSPMVTAYTARDLQDFSRGRFRLGLGTQIKAHIQRRFSVPWESPGPKLRDYVQALRHIWESWNGQHPLHYQGKFYHFSLMTPIFDPGPSPYPMPPVLTGAVNAYNCQIAGEVSDGLALHPLTSPEYVRGVVLPNLANGGSRSGRDPSIISVTARPFLATGVDEASVREEVERVRQRIAFYSSTRIYWPVLEFHGFNEIGERLHQMSLIGQWREMGKLISDEMLHTFAIVGRYEEIVEKLVHSYGGLLHEVSLVLHTGEPLGEALLRKLIRQLQESSYTEGT